MRNEEITVAAAAARAGVHRMTIASWAKTGAVRSRKGPYRRMIDVRSLATHLAARGRRDSALEAAQQALRAAVATDWHLGQALARNYVEVLFR